MTRHVIVVDVETSGLDFERCIAVEVAWENMTTGASGVFIPWHSTMEVMPPASEAAALQMCGYDTRLRGRKQDNGLETLRLYNTLAGHTLAGANPAFDARFLTKMFTRSGRTGMVAPWHHRMLDLESYTAGALGLPFNNLPGLAKVCELLGVTNGAPHTALGDVRATVECFRRLDKMRTDWAQVQAAVEQALRLRAVFAEGYEVVSVARGIVNIARYGNEHGPGEQA